MYSVEKAVIRSIFDERSITLLFIITYYKIMCLSSLSSDPYLLLKSLLFPIMSVRGKYWSLYRRSRGVN